MYNIIFYKDKDGQEPLREYLEKLRKEPTKDNRIKLNKITEYMRVLKQYGTRAGEPYCKHIEKNLWELRPSTERIFFFFWINDTFVLLNHFTKKTQKTPKKEIEKALKMIEDYLSGVDKT